MNNDVMNNDVMNNDVMNNDVMNNDVMNNDVMNNDVMNNDVMITHCGREGAVGMEHVCRRGNGGGFAEVNGHC